MSKIFNQTANESFLSKLTNLVDPVFRCYIRYVIILYEMDCDFAYLR